MKIGMSSKLRDLVISGCFRGLEHTVFGSRDDFNGSRPPVVVASTTYPSAMEKKVRDKAAMALARDWVTSTQTHAMYPGSGPSFWWAIAHSFWIRDDFNGS